MIEINETWLNSDDGCYYTRISHKDVISCTLCLFDNTGPCNVGQFCCRAATSREIRNYNLKAKK